MATPAEDGGARAAKFNRAADAPSGSGARRRAAPPEEQRARRPGAWPPGALQLGQRQAPVAAGDRERVVVDARRTSPGSPAACGDDARASR